MNADALKHLFDQNSLLLMFAWGLLCRHLPQLKAIPNITIPYVNTGIYILGKLATGTAFAACADCPPEKVPAVAAASAVSLAGLGGLNALIQALAFDKLVKPVLDKLGIKKAV